MPMGRTAPTRATALQRPWPAAPAPAPLQRPALAHRLAPRSALRDARLDLLFERLVRAFRADLLRALQGEPAGPARCLRAYLRSVCDHALRPDRRQARALQLLMQPPYETIWRDFVAEALAGDTVDGDLAQQCRAAAEALWLRRTADSLAGRDPGDGPRKAPGGASVSVDAGAPRPAPGSPPALPVVSVRDYLLSLCDASADAPLPPVPARNASSPIPQAPH